jgi:hypothetical protein
MKLSRVLLMSIGLVATVFDTAKATRAEVVCDSPAMLDTVGPIRPNQHCWRIASAPPQDMTVPGPWEARTGGACRAYSGLLQGRRVYWRKCSE